MKKTLLFAAGVAFLFASCNNDDYTPIESSLDLQLNDLLDEASNGEGKTFFAFPESDDYTNIPQDPLNPLTAEKVALGKLLMHETATGGNPQIADMKNTYSCASCHQAAAGFAQFQSWTLRCNQPLPSLTTST